jgi:hypothetical protein
LSVSGVPQFSAADRDVLFVKTSERAISPIVRVAYGRFRVVRDAARGIDVVRTYTGAPIGASGALSAPQLFASPYTGAEVSLQQFGEEITRRIAAARDRR